MEKCKINKEVIVFIGPIGSGKDYRFKHYENLGYKKVCFADGVRDICWSILGWSPTADYTYDDFKLSTLSTELEIRTILDKNLPGFVEIKNITISPKTGRQLLIDIGDGFRKYFYEDIWIDKLIKKISESDHYRFVISDCRYVNEVIKLYENFSYVKFIFCNYKSSRYTLLPDEPSEQLAFRLVNAGFEDGDELRLSQISSLYEN